MKHLQGYDGPRPILRRERRSGQELLKICFGWGDPDSVQGAGDEDDSTGDRGWIVMLPSNGPFRGKVVSQTGVFPSQILYGDSKVKIGSIGGVCTHPDFRGKGLAGHILEYCAQQLSAEGVHLMLISGDRGLYTRTGNIKAMRFKTYHLAAGKLNKPDWMPEVTVRQFELSDAPVLSKLYHAEAVHFRRQVRNFEESFAPGDLWIVEYSGAPVAYFLRMPWFSEPGKLLVVEYAGSRMALAAGFYQMLTGVDDPPHGVDFQELSLQAPWQDVDLTHLIDWMGVQATPDPLWGHTMRLVNFPALRKDLGGYIAARLPPALRRGLHFEQSGPLLVDPEAGESGDGRCALVWRSSRLDLSTAQMTRLVLGDWGTIDEGGLAQTAVQAPLNEIVRLLFPLPSFQPGLNLR